MNFSLVMPIRNGELYIPSIRQSVEKMMREGDELVIIDDNSEDSTLQLLREWAIGNNQIRIISNPNPGLAHALNLGIAESTHDLIARVDVDDDYDPSRLFFQEQMLSADCVAVFTDYTFQSDTNRYLGYMPSAITPLSTSLSLVSSSRTPHPSVVFRKDAFYSVGGYSQDDFPCEDLSLWLRLDKIGLIKSVPQPLLKYRLNKNGVSASKRDQLRLKSDELIEAIGLSFNVCNSRIEAWEEEIAQIDFSSLANIRKILLLRDLTIAKKKNISIRCSDSLRKLILNKVLTNLSTSMDIATLSYEKILRRIYR